ncbi:MAG: hypothetical protein M1831_001190, partial [Alyxoria varia]
MESDLFIGTLRQNVQRLSKKTQLYKSLDIDCNESSNCFVVIHVPDRKYGFYQAVNPFSMTDEFCVKLFVRKRKPPASSELATNGCSSNAARMLARLVAGDHRKAKRPSIEPIKAAEYETEEDTFPTRPQFSEAYRSDSI